jgi:hypothetical protein
LTLPQSGTSWTMIPMALRFLPHAYFQLLQTWAQLNAISVISATSKPKSAATSLLTRPTRSTWYAWTFSGAMQPLVCSKLTENISWATMTNQRAQPEDPPSNNEDEDFGAIVHNLIIMTELLTKLKTRICFPPGVAIPNSTTHLYSNATHNTV